MVIAAPTYRYQSGTCHLELTGEPSALSQVSDRPLLRRSRFRLEIWPEPGEAEPVTGSPLVVVRGEPGQLLSLQGQVQSYLQRHRQGTILGRWSVVLPRPALLSRQPRALQLSTLQLADLSEVLDQMDRGVALLSPEILPQRRSPAPAVSLGSVAAGLVAAVVGSQWLTQAPRPLEDALVRSPGPGPSHLALPAPDIQPPSSPDPSPSVRPRPAPESTTRLAPTPGPITPPSADLPPPSPRAARPQSEAPRDDPDGLPRAETFTVAKTPAIAPGASSPLAFPWLDSLAQALPTTWLVPEGVDQPLHYSLTLASDGRVEAVEPLGELAKQYQAGLGLPQVGHLPLALTLPPGTQVEVIFWPDGRVQLRLPSEPPSSPSGEAVP
jgi:hypothetical protein